MDDLPIVGFLVGLVFAGWYAWILIRLRREVDRLKLQVAMLKDEEHEEITDHEMRIVVLETRMEERSPAQQRPLITSDPMNDFVKNGKAIWGFYSQPTTVPDPSPSTTVPVPSPCVPGLFSATYAAPTSEKKRSGRKPGSKNKPKGVSLQQ